MQSLNPANKIGTVLYVQTLCGINLRVNAYGVESTDASTPVGHYIYMRPRSYVSLPYA